MKKTVPFLLIASGFAGFLYGVSYGIWAAHTQKITVYMEDRGNAVRLKDGEYEWSEVRTPDGRLVTIVWHR